VSGGAKTPPREISALRACLMESDRRTASVAARKVIKISEGVISL